MNRNIYFNSEKIGTLTPSEISRIRRAAILDLDVWKQGVGAEKTALLLLTITIPLGFSLLASLLVQPFPNSMWVIAPQVATLFIILGIALKIIDSSMGQAIQDYYVHTVRINKGLPEEDGTLIIA